MDAKGLPQQVPTISTSPIPKKIKVDYESNSAGLVLVRKYPKKLATKYLPAKSTLQPTPTTTTTTTITTATTPVVVINATSNAATTATTITTTPTTTTVNATANSGITSVTTTTTTATATTATTTMKTPPTVVITDSEGGERRERSKSPGVRERSRERGERGEKGEKGEKGDDRTGRRRERSRSVSRGPKSGEERVGEGSRSDTRDRSESRGRGESRSESRSESRGRSESRSGSKSRSVSRSRSRDLSVEEVEERRVERQKKMGATPTSTWQHTIIVPQEWNSFTSEQKRDWFVQQAGGVFTSEADYDGIKHHRRFWDFYSDYGLQDKVLDIYAVDNVDGATVGELLDKDKISIEHIVPKVVLKELLIKDNAPHNVIRGARVNPFNFAPAHFAVNSLRGNYKFDLDGDQILKRGSFGEYLYDFVGFDYQHEWIVPLRSRGDVSRAMLYMVLLYGLKYLTKKEIEVLIQWCKDDPIEDYELLYDEWVHSHSEYNQITNPLITHPDMVFLPGLFDSVFVTCIAEPVPKGKIQKLRAKTVELPALRIIELLSKPRKEGKARREYLVLYNFGQVPITVDDSWQARVITNETNGADSHVYQLEPKEILPGYKRKIYFVGDDNNRAEVLPQKGAKVTLMFENKKVTSVKYDRLRGLPKESLDD